MENTLLSVRGLRAESGVRPEGVESLRASTLPSRRARPMSSWAPTERASPRLPLF